MTSPETAGSATMVARPPRQTHPVDADGHYGKTAAGMEHRGSASLSCSFGALTTLNGRDHHGPWTGGRFAAGGSFYIQPCLSWRRCHGSSRRSGYQRYISSHDIPRQTHKTSAQSRVYGAMLLLI